MTTIRFPRSKARLTPMSIPGYIYLMRRSDDGFYKIGLSRNPQTRLRTIQGKVMGIVELIHTIETNNMGTAEANLHKQFAMTRKENTEWFNLSPDDVEYITGIERYIVD